MTKTSGERAMIDAGSCGAPRAGSPRTGPVVPGTPGEHLGSRMFDRWAAHRANVVRAAKGASAVPRSWSWLLAGLTILLTGFLVGLGVG